MKRKDGVIGMLDDSFGLADCDGKERGSGVELFGVVRPDNRTFLLTVEHGWEDESYVIYELKGSGLIRLVETFVPHPARRCGKPLLCLRLRPSIHRKEYTS